jgi:hypothetical protein
MEQAAGVRYHKNGTTARDSPVLIRYADDFAVFCHSRQQAGEVIARLTMWLAPRGLSINDDKTQIVHLSQGFDFLGFNIRRYQTWRGGKLLWLGRLQLDPPGRPEVAPPQNGHPRCRLEMAPPRRPGGLPSWSAAFLDCCPLAGDELQVKVERPQRSEDVRP